MEQFVSIALTVIPTHENTFPNRATIYLAHPVRLTKCSNFFEVSTLTVCLLRKYNSHRATSKRFKRKTMSPL